MFMDFDYLSDGIVDLKIQQKIPANDEKGLVPAYAYTIHQHGLPDEIGHINIRIGNNDKLYFGGHIGYSVEEKFRGHHYAASACKLIFQVAKAHGMEKISITCNPENIASRKTCERAGAKFIRIVDLPPDNDMFLRGERQKCIYEIELR
jgi:tagatose 1,6-diphosphate aldolase